jgi:hypothetical protein
MLRAAAVGRQVAGILVPHPAGADPPGVKPVIMDPRDKPAGDGPAGTHRLFLFRPGERSRGAVLSMTLTYGFWAELYNKRFFEIRFTRAMLYVR